MIKVDKLNYSIDNRKLFNDSNIVVNEGELTVIYGESGSGKSTLLNILAFNIEADYSYSFNNIDINSLNQKEKINFRRDNIVYIHQDDTLISNYSLKDNARLIVEAKGQIFDENKLLELMKVVGIAQKKLNKPISNLSNGQRQRFAIICSMMVEAWLYIYDEPTSSMDKENALKVVELLKTFVSPEKMIIVSLHDKELITDGHTYLIEEGAINEIIPGNIVKPTSYEYINKKINKKLIFKEGFNNAIHSPIINTISIVSLSIIVALACLFSAFGNQLVATQVDNINGVYDNELFVINDVGYIDVYTGYNNFVNLAIDSETVSNMSNIENIAGIYPHVFLELGRHYDEYQDGKVGYQLLTDTKYNQISLVENGEVINQIDYADYFQYLSIDPFYPHHQIEDRCQEINEEVTDGIYISSYLAQLLGIDNIDNKSIHVYMTVPIASRAAGFYDDDGKLQLMRDKLSVLVELDIPIAGILKKTNYNFYKLTEPYMLLDYNVIQQLIDDKNKENIDWLEEYSNESQAHNILKEISDKDLLDTKWDASAYVIEVDSFENMDQVKSEIQKLNSSFVVRGFQVNGYVSTDLIKDQKAYALTFTVVLSLVIIILSIIIKYFKRKKTNKYYKYLNNIGLSKISIKQIKFIEFLIFILVLVILGIIFSFIIRNYISLPVVFDNSFIKIYIIEILIITVLMNLYWLE